MRGKLVAGLAAAVALLGVSDAALAQKAKRIRVAVMDFEYGTIDHWWGQYDIGKGMADQVVEELVEDGTFSVIERKKIDTVLAEQDFSRSDRADPKTALKLGKLLGVRYIIAGSIVKFSTERKNIGGTLKGVRLGLGKAKSEVHLSARMIDTTTGEILIAAKGQGESKKGGGVDFGKGGTSFDMSSPEFRDSALGDAQAMACKELVAQFVAKKDRLE